MGAELVPDATQVSPGESLRFTLVNNGPGHVGYGHPYEVQRLDDGAWVDADVQEPGTAFTLAAHSMPAGRTFAQVLPLRNDVSPGRYRVTKGVAIEGSGNVTLSFAFTVLGAEGAV
jgi:hypothetical protein